MNVVVVAFVVSMAVAGSALAASKENSAECPRSWDFGTGSLSFIHSTLYIGSLPVPESDDVRLGKGESWTDFDMRKDAPRRPAFLSCVYKSRQGSEELVLRLPDAVSKCVLHEKKQKGGNALLSHRCVWPSGDKGKAEVFVPEPFGDDADVMGIGVRKDESDLKAAVASRGGRWVSREDGGERIADIEFPGTSIKLTVRFSASSGTSRQVEAREPMSDPSNLVFSVIRRYGLPGFSSGCSAWQDGKAVRIEYGAASRSVRLMRLLDLKDPATRTWSPDSTEK